MWKQSEVLGVVPYHPSTDDAIPSRHFALFVSAGLYVTCFSIQTEISKLFPACHQFVRIFQKEAGALMRVFKPLTRRVNNPRGCHSPLYIAWSIRCDNRATACTLAWTHNGTSYALNSVARTASLPRCPMMLRLVSRARQRLRTRLYFVSWLKSASGYGWAAPMLSYCLITFLFWVRWKTPDTQITIA